MDKMELGICHLNIFSMSSFIGVSSCLLGETGSLQNVAVDEMEGNLFGYWSNYVEWIEPTLYTAGFVNQINLGQL